MTDKHDKLAKEWTPELDYKKLTKAELIDILCERDERISTQTELLQNQRQDLLETRKEYSKMRGLADTRALGIQELEDKIKVLTRNYATSVSENAALMTVIGRLHREAMAYDNN